MKTANEQGTLVLLQNLDPVYTSAEVEVLLILELMVFYRLYHLVWHIDGGWYCNQCRKKKYTPSMQVSFFARDFFFFSRSYILSKINCCVFLIVPSF